MASESIHKKKARVRPPRVHISYDVEIGDAMVQKELPFVTGVMADLSGQPKEALPKLKERKFVEIDRDNFDDVLKSMKPRLAFRAENKLQDDGSQLNVELNFASMEDFRPENVAKQVKPMNDLLEIRSKLKDLLSRMEGNDRLEEMLDAIVNEDGVRDKLKDVLNVGADGGSEPEAPESSEDS